MSKTESRAERSTDAIESVPKRSCAERWGPTSQSVSQSRIRITGRKVPSKRGEDGQNTESTRRSPPIHKPGSEPYIKREVQKKREGV